MKIIYGVTIMSNAKPIKRFRLSTTQAGPNPGWFPRGLGVALGPVEGYVEAARYIPELDVLEVYLSDILLTNEEYERELPLIYEDPTVMSFEWEEIKDQEEEEEEEDG